MTTIAGTLPSQGADGQAADATQMASRIAGHVRGRRPPAGPPPPSSSGTDGSWDSALGQGIDALSSALGIGGDDLMDRLTAGTGISDLLAADPDLAAQLNASDAKGAMIDGYA